MRKLLAVFAVMIGFSLVTPFAQAEVQSVSPNTDQVSCPALSRNLSVGARGADVLALQKFLNSRGFQIAASGSGAPGLESTLFGAKTRAALIRFQVANSITPASGFLGALTRAKISALCGAAAAAPSGSAPTPTLAGTGGGNGIAFTPQITAPSELTTPQPTFTPPTNTSQTTQNIDPSSIVGIMCTYRHPDGQITLMKGSGVIVNPEGFVLTARHIVDPRWTAGAYSNALSEADENMYLTSTLEGCEIGLPENISLPTSATLITSHFQYNAATYYVPSHSNLSDYEYNTADVAVLKITTATSDCEAWNSHCADFGHFAYTPISTNALPQVGAAAISTYGYPAEPGLNDSNSNFESFYLKGSFGTIGSYFNGSSRFMNEPESFSLEAQDIQSGRSGSPVFSGGRVIGILYGSTSNNESFNLAMPAITKLLGDAGLSGVLTTQ